MNTLESDLCTWELIMKEDLISVLPSKWAVRIKWFPDGLMKKCKARFCVRSDLQKEGIYYFKSWSPVVQWTTGHTMMILAANHYLITAKADVTAAFVHAELATNEHIHIRLPAGFRCGQNMVLKLKRSVYSLSSMVFVNYIKDHLEPKELGLKQSSWDTCLVGNDVIVVVYEEVLPFTVKEQLKNLFMVHIERSISQEGRRQITFHQKGLTAQIIIVMGFDSSLGKIGHTS
ncbi:LOW QUALITY PROTEIN: hypothetical protein ACHAW6_003434 [Cyclotella cf. meneghiniana]